MGNIKRTIEISANADGVSRAFSDLGSSLSRAFEEANQKIERVSGNVDDFSQVVDNRMMALEQSVDKTFSSMLEKSKQQTNSTKERLEFMQKELTLAERILRNETEKAKLAERMKHNNNMQDARDSGATPDQINSLKQAHSSKMAGMDEDAKIKELQMRSMRERFIQHRDDSIDEERKKSNEVDGNNEVEEVTKQAGRGFVQGYGLAGVLSVSGFVSKMISEGKILDEAESSTRGLASRSIGGSGNGYGMKRADFLNYAKTTLQSAGNSNYDAMGNLAFEKRFSQNLGSLNGITGGLRMGQGGRTASQVAIEMLNFFKRSKIFGVDKGDFTQLSEKLEFSNQMLQQQGDQMDRVNATTNAQIMTAFGGAGIGDQRMLKYSNQVNQSITNPNNDFTQAFMFRSLRRKNPNAGLLDILKIQEQGIYGEGTFGQIMKDLKGAFSGDALTMSISKAFGVKYHQADKLQRLDQSQLDAIGSKSDIDQFMSSEDAVNMRTGKGGAGVVSRRLAGMDDWFAKYGKKAIYKVEEYMSEYDKGGFGGVFGKIGSDLYSSFKPAIDNIGDYFKESMSNAVNSMLGIESEQEQLDKALKDRKNLDSEVESKYGGLTGNILKKVGHKGSLKSYLQGNSSIRYMGKDEGWGGLNDDFDSPSSQMKALTYSLLKRGLMDNTIEKPMSHTTQKDYGLAWRNSPEYQQNIENYEKGGKMVDELVLNNSNMEKVAGILERIYETSQKNNITVEEASKKVFNDVYENY